MIVTVGDKEMKATILFSEVQIKERVAQLGLEIQQSYPDESELVVLIVLNGALIFGADLVRHIQHKIQIQTIRLQSYEGTHSSGRVTVLGEAPIGLTDKHVLIVEDIVDTGRSLDFLFETIRHQGCKSIKVACLLDKPASHEFPVSPEFVGFTIGRNFVIGYGLDLDGLFRQLPYIAELVP